MSNEQGKAFMASYRERFVKDKYKILRVDDYTGFFEVRSKNNTGDYWISYLTDEKVDIIHKDNLDNGIPNKDALHLVGIDANDAYSLFKQHA